MKRIIGLLRHHEIQALLLVAGFAALTWPVMGGSAMLVTRSVYNHLFIAWSLIIAVLFLMQFAHVVNGRIRRRAKGAKREGPPHV